MTAASSSWPRKGGRIAFLLLFGVALALVMGEVAIRAGLFLKGRPYDGMAIRAQLSELLSRVQDAIPLPGDIEDQDPEQFDSGLQIVHPFLGFDALGTQLQMTIDMRERAKPDPRFYRIAILGGSVSGVFGRYGTERLAELLRASPLLAGREIEFMGYGRGGYKQPQQVIRLVHILVSGIRPDAVLNLDGFNEVAIGNQNRAHGIYPTYPSYYHWMRFVHAMGGDEEMRQLFNAAREEKDELVLAIESALERDWFASALWGYLRRSGVVRQRRTFEAARFAYMNQLGNANVAPGVLGPQFDGDARAAVEVCVRTWAESSRQIDALCKLYDIDYLHVLHPTLHDPGAKIISQEERDKGGIAPTWLEGVEIGYPLLRLAGQQLAREGIRFLDASRVFQDVEETLYYDACHFNPEGNRILAAAIAPAFLELISD